MSPSHKKHIDWQYRKDSTIPPSPERETSVYVETHTAERIKLQMEYVQSLRVKDKRFIFAQIRNSDDQCNPELFFPQYGINACAVSVGQVLTNNSLKSKA